MRRTWRPMLPIAVVFLLLSVISAAPSAAATLKVSSFPSGAQVIVDGVNTGKVTPMNISLPDGDHVVTVQIPGSGWNPDTRTVTIVAGNNDLSVTLLPIPTPGPPGPPGPPGIQGPMGVPGPASALTSYEELAGLPCRTGANADATVHLVGLLKRPLCAATISANGRFVDLGTAVFDLQTNLLWEKKGSSGDLHDVNNRYTWCVATGIDTSPAIGSNLCAGAGLSWISHVNAEALGGFSDWRIPTREELATIHTANACQANTPCTDPVFGPSLYVGFTSNFGFVLGGPYWASNMETGGFGFVVDFFGAPSPAQMSILPEFQALDFPVRAVRTGW